MFSNARALFGGGTPNAATNVGFAFLFIVQTAEVIAFVILVVSEAQTAAMIVVGVSIAN
jgi:hypothetical protein